MKKVFILFSLPLLIFSCDNSGNNENAEAETPVTIEMERNNWENSHLQGQVKSIVETPYTPDESGAIADMDSCCVEVIDYDSNGFIVKSTEKNKEGQVTVERVLEHTETGKFVSNTETENGKVVWKRVVVRDEEGNIMNAFDSDSTQQVTRIHKGEVYNEYNQPISGKTFNNDSVYLGTWTWQYIDGLRAGRSWTDSTGVVLRKRTGEVNDKGWLSKVIDMEVDDAGVATTTVETYTYESFDETGNWTQRTEYNDGAAVQVVKRAYTYYGE